MTIRLTHIFGLLLVVGLIVGGFSSVYQVPEGHVGIVKTWGKATAQTDPGLNFKVPFVESVELMEVRQRNNVEVLHASTLNQLAVKNKFSLSWRAKKSAALELFKKYGGLQQFEDRVIDPRIRSAAKAVIAQYNAAELVRKREHVADRIRVAMTDRLRGLPMVVISAQSEDYVLPDDYMKAIREKEKARQNAEKEQHKLEQQRLVALQQVNTAEAEAKSKRINADAEAYRLVETAKAEADAIRMVTEQLQKSPHYIQLVQAKRWDGRVSRVMLGNAGSSNGVATLLQLPSGLAK